MIIGDAGLTGRVSPKLFLYSIVPVFAVLITLLTGLGYGYVHGRPLPWIMGGCGPPGTLSACFLISYDWSAFVMDVLFYAVVGYGLLLGYGRYHAGKSEGFSPRQN
jgi:hypothetical protein